MCFSGYTNDVFIRWYGANRISVEDPVRLLWVGNCPDLDLED